MNTDKTTCRRYLCKYTALPVLLLGGILCSYEYFTNEDRSDPTSEVHYLKRVKHSSLSSVRHTPHISLSSVRHTPHIKETVRKKSPLWTCSPNDRLLLLHQACFQNRLQFLNSDINFGNQFIVDDKRKLIFCQVPHVGSHSLKTVIKDANINNTRKPIGGKKVDTPMGDWSHGLETHGLTHMARLLPKYSNYTKFLVVRHPFDRVISMYNSIRKFSHHLNPTATDYLKNLYNAGPYLHKLTFANFVSFLTHGSTPSYLYNNPHWRSITETCFPCHIKYNRVIKLETIETHMDTSYLQQIGILSPQKVPHLHNNDFDNKSISNGSQYLQSFSSVPLDAVNKLKNRYRLDMEIFGYSFDSKDNKAFCKRPTSHSSKAYQQCC